VRSAGTLIVLGALFAFGCAAAREPQRESHGLVRVKTWRPGNLFTDPARSIDDYDDIWLAEVGIQYAEGQAPLAEEDERRLRKLLYDVALEELPLATRLGAREQGVCTLTMGVHLAALAFPMPGFTGPRNRGSALVVVELKDSQSDEPLVRYGQRRDLVSAGRWSEAQLDLERLEPTLQTALEEVGTAMRRALPVKATGARAAQGCKGAVGEARKESRGAL